MGMYINGDWISHALCEFSAAIPGKGTKKYRGVTVINYNDELTRTLEYGTGSVSLGSSVGQYKPAADVEFLKNEGQRFIDDAGDGFGAVLVSLVVAYRPLSANGKLHVDKIPDCNVMKLEDASAKGDEGNKTKFTLLVNGVISRNGKRIIVPPSNKLAIR